MEHPDIRAFETVTGGRIPGASQYAPVIDTVRFLRQRKRLGEAGLVGYLKPFWLAWRSRKRKDGRGYDPGNITWLTEWALNGSIPPSGGAVEKEARGAQVPSPEATRRMLAEKDEKLEKAVPPPTEAQAKIRSLAGQLGVAVETISRWENGALTQTRAMDRYLRVYFGVPAARAALAEQSGTSHMGIHVET